MVHVEFNHFFGKYNHNNINIQPFFGKINHQMERSAFVFINYQ